MAKSGSREITVTNWDTLRFSWTAGTQSTANNTTSVSWKMELVAGSYGAISSGTPKVWSVTINGQTFSGTNTIGISNNTTKTLASGTVIIKHNNDGRKTFNYSFSQAFDITWGDAEQIGTKSGSGTGTLDTIARESTLATTYGTLGESLLLMITPKDSTFKHRIQYTCGSVTGYVAGSASTWTTETKIYWTPPLSLAQQNTTGTSVSIKFTLGTYTSGGTLVGGFPTTTITCAIPESVKPSCSLTLEDVNNIDDIYGSPVQGLSRIKITVNTTLAQGSPIASYVITADGKTYTTSPSTTPLLINAGSSPITATVKDKRGRTGTASYTMNVQAYNKPAVSKLTVHRCNSNGVENDQGEYARVTFSASVTPMSNKNTAAYRLRYKKTAETAWTDKYFTEVSNTYTVTDYEWLFAADGNSSYDVELIVTDRHHTSTTSTTVSTAFTLINFHESGTGLRFGGIAEKENLLQNDLNFRQAGNSYAFQPSAFSGDKGYTLLAVVKLTAVSVNAPIVFNINRRGADCPMIVYVRFANSSATTDPDLASITYEGDNYGAFMVKSATSTWKLYVDNTGGWSNPCLQDWYTTDNQSSRLTVEFPSEQATTLPQPYYRATPVKMQSLLDYIYPVGSVYISWSHVNPGTMFGGTWERISNAFLWACDADGTIGQTGGEKTHTLTVNELPSHSHGSVYSQHADNTKSYAWYTTAGSSVAYGAVETGGGAAHNNMPPYVQVSMWRRTS